jgi:beta-galactosidase
MKHIVILIVIVFALLSTTKAQRREMLLDDDWKFNKGDVANAWEDTFNDAGWRIVHLPHDWSVEDLPNQSSDSIIGPFWSKSIGATATGYTVGGTTWYRKHVTVNNSDNKKVSILFDGVYMNSDVWVNGHFIGNHPYGYTPFYYDITPYLKPPGMQNTIAVRVRNEGRNSRWYSGSGIYRQVWLIVTNPAHIQQWGVYITTPKVSANTATVNIQTAIENRQNNLPMILKTYITDASGKTVASAQRDADDTVHTDIQLSNPHLWSPNNPYLYTANTELWQHNTQVDK